MGPGAIFIVVIFLLARSLLKHFKTLINAILYAFDNNNLPSGSFTLNDETKNI